MGNSLLYLYNMMSSATSTEDPDVVLASNAGAG